MGRVSVSVLAPFALARELVKQDTVGTRQDKAGTGRGRPVGVVGVGHTTSSDASREHLLELKALHPGHHLLEVGQVRPEAVLCLGHVAALAEGLGVGAPGVHEAVGQVEHDLVQLQNGKMTFLTWINGTNTGTAWSQD